MRVKKTVWWAMLGAAWLLPLAAEAAPVEQAVPDDDEPEPIYGGEPAGPCDWPSAVSLSSCTGTLIHPQLVMYAAHCGSSYGSVFFGDDTSGAGFSVGTTGCQVHPNWNGIGSGTDFAFCKLSRPVTEVPYTPPLMGCEVDVLQPGREVWIVGFGENDDGGYGTKYEAKTTFNYFDSVGDASIGHAGTTVCFGDSGGPAYVRLPEDEGFDGSWRAFGIASYVYTPCGNEGFSAVMHRGIEWVEDASGLDVTPCHDADGTWNPSEDCKDFQTQADTGQGSWQTGCEAGPLAGWGATCGPSWAETMDAAAPVVTIVAPSSGEVMPAGAGGMADLTVEVEATDAESGVVQVELLLDGVAVGGPDTQPPWVFELTLPIGDHTLGATAKDAAENTGHGSDITISVEAVDDDDGGGVGTSGDGGGSDDGGWGSSTGSVDDDDGDDIPPPQDTAALPPGFGLDQAPTGCACTTTQRFPEGLVLLVLVPLVLVLGAGAVRRRQ